MQLFAKILALKMPINGGLVESDQFLRAIAECFARLSHRLGVCLSVRHTLALNQNGAS